MPRLTAQPLSVVTGRFGAPSLLFGPRSITTGRRLFSPVQHAMPMYDTIADSILRQSLKSFQSLQGALQNTIGRATDSGTAEEGTVFEGFTITSEHGETPKITFFGNNRAPESLDFPEVAKDETATSKTADTADEIASSAAAVEPGEVHRETGTASSAGSLLPNGVYELTPDGQAIHPDGSVDATKFADGAETVKTPA